MQPMLTWNTPPGDLGIFKEGTTLNIDLGASGGVAPYRLEVINFFLPLNILIDQNSMRLIGQIPNEKDDKTYSFNIRIIDSNNESLTNEFYFKALNSNSPPNWNSYPINSVNRIIDLGTIISGSQPPILNLAYDVDVELGNNTLTYSIINGSLPYGLSLSPTGTLIGIPRTFNETSQTSVFTIRAWDGIQAVDREFKLRVITGNDIPVWYTNSGNIGTIQSLTYNIIILDAKDPIFTNLTFRLISGLLPDGMVLSNTGIISGIPIQEITTSYTTTFIIGVSNGLIEVARSFSITVVPQDFSQLNNIPVWPDLNGQPEPINLGFIYEFSNSYFQVFAENATSYRLSPVSGELPLGMFLDETSGELNGFVGGVSTTTDYIFTIRAFTLVGMADRTFKITVGTRTSANSPSIVSTNLVSHKRPLLSYGLNLLYQQRQNLLFKPNDKNYGIQLLPNMYVFSGPDNMSLLSLWNAMIRPGTTDTFSFQHRTTATLGALKTASYITATGERIYDVIYYDVIDSQHDGGLFIDNIPQPVPPPQNIVNLDDFYISNFKSWRSELYRQLPSIELLPEWMDCQQIPGNPASRLGWIPAIPIIYTKPNKALEMLAWATVNNNPIIGMNMLWDISFYIVKTLKVNRTDFDNSLTTFENNNTSFDTVTMADQIIYFPQGENTEQ